MAINLQTLGRRLRAAREECRVTQEEAAASLGIPRTAIVQIESGNRQVSTLELATLADLYNRPITDFFREDEPVDEDVIHTLYRIEPGLEDNPTVQQDVLRCVRLCREGVQLESLLGMAKRQGPPDYKLSHPRNVSEAVRQGEEAALAERKRVGIEDAPIADMADLISNQGIWCSGAHLLDQVSGLFLRHPSFGMAIIVNFEHRPARKRFSYAHEYAHALLDRDKTVTVTKADNRRELPEVRANAFAAAFLMPTKGVEAFLAFHDKGAPSRQSRPVYDYWPQGEAAVQAHFRPAAGSQTITYQDVAQLAHHFGASYQASVYRLRSLGYVNQQECEALLTQEMNDLGARYMKALGMCDEETNPKPDRELVSQVAHLVVEAFRREEISCGKVRDTATLLGIAPRDLIEFAEATRTT